MTSTGTLRRSPCQVADSAQDHDYVMLSEDDAVICKGVTVAQSAPPLAIFVT